MSSNDQSVKTDRSNLMIKLYAIAIGLLSVVSLIYVYAIPPASMRVDRDGIDHFTPDVLHPETGERIGMADLIRHFRGD